MSKDTLHEDGREGTAAGEQQLKLKKRRGTDGVCRRRRRPELEPKHEASCSNWFVGRRGARRGLSGPDWEK